MLVRRLLVRKLINPFRRVFRSDVEIEAVMNRAIAKAAPQIVAMTIKEIEEMRIRAARAEIPLTHAMLDANPAWRAALRKEWDDAVGITPRTAQ